MAIVLREFTGSMTLIEARIQVDDCGGAARELPPGIRAHHIATLRGRHILLLKGTLGHDIEAAVTLFAAKDKNAHWRLLDPHFAVVSVAEAAGPLSPVDPSMGFPLLPGVWTHGTVEYTFATYSRTSLDALVRALSYSGSNARILRWAQAPCEALTMRRYVTTAAADLTARQLDVLVDAVERGYYDAPRTVEAKELAAELDLSVSTFQEHLRKAEKRVLEWFCKIARENPGIIVPGRRVGRPPRRSSP